MDISRDGKLLAVGTKLGGAGSLQVYTLVVQRVFDEYGLSALTLAHNPESSCQVLPSLPPQLQSPVTLFPSLSQGTIRVFSAML